MIVNIYIYIYKKQFLTVDIQHLCLENLLNGFTRPCIMDLKIGSRLYDNDATEEKIIKMKENAKGTTIESLACRIAGMKVKGKELKMGWITGNIIPTCLYI